MSEENKYRIVATLYESCVGLGLEEEAFSWKAEVEKFSSKPWMRDSTEEQIEKLRQLLS